MIKRIFIYLLFSTFTYSLIADYRVSRGRIASETGFELKVLAEDLFLPWGIAWLPDGSAVITEKRGTLRTFKNGKLSDAIDFPVEVTSGGSGGITRGQGGLMDVVASPDFKKDKLLYFTYSTGDSSANRTEIARGQWDGKGLKNFEVLWKNPDTKRSGQHFGARILFLPDGTFLASVGDGGNPPVMLKGDEIRKQAQNPATAFGKTFRFNPDGSIPEDNPSFEGESLPGLWTYGHRNIQGLARNPETGVIWANEHGAAAGDELNIIEPGTNYGWPAATYSRNYGSGTLISDKTQLPGMKDPRVVWLDTHAPSGLVIYQGEEFPDWNGAVLSGGLITRDIRMIKQGESEQRPTESRIAIGQRVRDVRQDHKGHLFVLTDSQQGQLIQIVPTK